MQKHVTFSRSYVHQQHFRKRLFTRKYIYFLFVKKKKKTEETNITEKYVHFEIEIPKSK